MKSLSFYGSWTMPSCEYWGEFEFEAKPDSISDIEQPAIPTFAPLSTQMVQSFSYVPATKNCIYEQIRQNIQNALRDVLPEIVELDKKYKEICKAFAMGECTPKPEGMQSEFMPYQWRGYQWMEIFYKFGIGGCLADEMGLGKTIQSIALIQAIINQKKEKGSTARILISCPANLITNWKRELEENCPSLKSQVRVIERKRKKQKETAGSIYLISHMLLRRLASSETFPFNQEWDLAVFDEFHCFLKSQISKNVINLLRQKVQGPEHGFIALTGTPMPNNLHELYQLNAMLNPTVYPPINAFNESIITPANQAMKDLLLMVRQNEGKMPADVALDQVEEYVVQLIEILTKPFLLRRRNQCEEFKAQIATMHSRGSEMQSLLPLGPEVKVHYPLTELQKQLIQTVVADNTDELEQATKIQALSLFHSNLKMNGDENKLELRDYLCLQFIANHTSLLFQSRNLVNYLKQENPFFDHFIKDKKIAVNYAEPGKLHSIMELVKDILDQKPNEKILIFTNFQEMGHLICKSLKFSVPTSTMRKVKFLYGKVKQAERTQIIKEFHERNGPPVLVAGRKLGSMGWNCTTANHLILVDPWWNPNDDDQCIARLYRIGQKNLVHVYRMHHTGFIADDKMDRMRIEKKAWCELILSANTSQVKQRIREIMEGNTSVSSSNSLSSSIHSLVESMRKFHLAIQ